MPVSSGPVISYVGWFNTGETDLVRIAPVPMVDYVDAVKQLLEAKSGDKVPQLVRARIGYSVELRDYEPYVAYPGYCYVTIDVTGVDWQGKEYDALTIVLSADDRKKSGSVDITEHYRLPPLMLVPFKLAVSVDCLKALLDMDIELYVEWGW